MNTNQISFKDIYNKFRGKWTWRYFPTNGKWAKKKSHRQARHSNDLKRFFFEDQD